MSTHNLCFRAKIRKMYTPVHPSFTVQKWGVRGYSLHGHVFVMRLEAQSEDTGRPPHSEISDLSLHCLLTCMYIQQK